MNRVLVPVVVRDARGRAIADLKKEDFQVFDNGEPQTISAFSLQTRAMTEQRSQNSAQLNTDAAQAVVTADQPRRFTVFLIDDMHSSASDLGKIQRLGTKMLAPALSESDMAAVVSISGDNSGLTHDGVQLEEALRKLKTHSLYQHEVRQCPDVDYRNADLIQNKRDGMALELAIQETLACANLDPHRMRNIAEGMVRSAANNALVVGDQDTRVALAATREYVRKMATLPGQRILVIVSPGFLTLSPEAMSKKAEILDLAARSDVTINTLDARELYATEGDASERGPGSAMAMQTDYDAQSHRENAMLVEDVLAEFAEGTGGSYFHNSNDLEAGFQRAVAAPEYVYMLELSPGSVKIDGRYHRLKVKIDRDNVSVQARRGYFASRPEHDLTAKSAAAKENERPQDQRPAGSDLPEAHTYQPALRSPVQPRKKRKLPKQRPESKRTMPTSAQSPTWLPIAEQLVTA